MCGIVALIGRQPIQHALLQGLNHLEYRGYDSAGVALIEQAQLITHHAVGKVNALEALLANHAHQSTIGIAHTRWATHGPVTVANTHPHTCANEIAIVHNGIINNAETLKTHLPREHTFSSDTDSELIAHWLHWQTEQGLDMLAALKHFAHYAKGSYAVVVLDRKHPDTLWAICQQSPLVLGLSDECIGFASDPLALITHTQEFIYLQCGDCVCIHLETGYHIEDINDETQQRTIHSLQLPQAHNLKENFKHHMLKEIHEQPKVLQTLIKQTETLPTADYIQFVGCGSSYYAGLIGQYWLQKLAQLPSHVSIASEYRYLPAWTPKNSMLISLSQSGETADTVAAIRHGKTYDYTQTLTLCNTEHSSLARLSDRCLPLLAGPEIGVASTKAYTAQLMRLLLLTLQHAPAQPTLRTALKTLPQRLETLLQHDGFLSFAQTLAPFKQLMLIGQGLLYPTALEGALKLKEITYVPAQAYPAGELKHGPLALIDAKMPTIALLADNELSDKVLANIVTIQSRGGPVLVIHEASCPCPPEVLYHLSVPNIHPMLTPFTFTVALQLIAYHLATLRGIDIDQPRNLAKSVTVE